MLPNLWRDKMLTFQCQLSKQAGEKCGHAIGTNALITLFYLNNYFPKLKNMDRIIKLADLEKAVDEVFSQFKDDSEGELDPRIKDADSKAFGISVTLTDGTVISRGDADVKSAMGSIAKIPTSILLLSQLRNPDDLVEKAGCGCKAANTCGKKLKSLSILAG